jgi:hypothetical protein
MKQILIEIDDRCARDLDRVAPPKKRMRAEFIRLAIRRAVDLALDRATVRAYAANPLSAEVSSGDLVGWDGANELAQVRPRGAARRRGAKSAA